MKRVSVAQAKNQLPALLHETEREAVEIVRRGEPVAVLLSRAEYDRMRGESTGFWEAIQRVRSTYDLEELDVSGALEGVRDRSPGRKVRL